MPPVVPPRRAGRRGFRRAPEQPGVASPLMILTVSAIAAAISVMFKVMNVAPKLQEKLAKYRGKPTAEERKVLVQFCRTISERRVFYAPYDSEVVEGCVGSLREVKNKTEKVLASISNPGVQALLGAFLDDVRAFLDKWSGKSTPRGMSPDSWGPERHAPWRDREADLPEFFRGLGQLRERAVVWFAWLAQIEPKAKIPKFGDAQPKEAGTRDDAGTA